MPLGFGGQYGIEWLNTKFSPSKRGPSIYVHRFYIKLACSPVSAAKEKTGSNAEAYGLINKYYKIFLYLHKQWIFYFVISSLLSKI